MEPLIVKIAQVPRRGTIMTQRVIQEEYDSRAPCTMHYCYDSRNERFARPASSISEVNHTTTCHCVARRLKERALATKEGLLQQKRRAVEQPRLA